MQPGELFACWSGERYDGHAFAEDAVRKGAAVILCERFLEHLAGVPQLVVPESRKALGRLAAVMYGHPSQRLHLIGVTGTNGKTTSTYLIKAIFEAAGKKTGLIGTIQHLVGDEPIAAARTTPEAPDLQALLSTMVARGCKVAVMEVSSHGVALHRIEGCRFGHGLFTNLTQDHLDYHGTFEAYRETKARFFTLLREGGAVNADDANADRFLTACRAPAWRYSIERPDVEVRARDVRVEPSGVRYMVDTPVGSEEVRLLLTGRFNVYNSLGAIATGLQAGIDLRTTVAALRRVQVPGRFERVERGQPFTVIVDYAHTPDSLANVLQTARQLTAGRVIVIFGAGGDRDRGKRPQMGRVAATWADLIVVTSDNPRSEDPQQICDEIFQGVREAGGAAKARIRLDRREAIREGIDAAEAGDLVLIAGKGHETYQEFRHETVQFDDRAEAARALEERLGSARTEGI